MGRDQTGILVLLAQTPVLARLDHLAVRGRPRLSQGVPAHKDRAALRGLLVRMEIPALLDHKVLRELLDLWDRRALPDRKDRLGHRVHRALSAPNHSKG